MITWCINSTLTRDILRLPEEWLEIRVGTGAMEDVRKCLCDAGALL